MGHSRLAGSGGRHACSRYLRKAHSFEEIQLRSRSGGAHQHDHARWKMKTRLRQGAGRPSRLPLRGSDEGRSRGWDTAAKDGPQARPSTTRLRRRISSVPRGQHCLPQLHMPQHSISCRTRGPYTPGTAPKPVQGMAAGYQACTAQGRRRGFPEDKITQADPAAPLNVAEGSLRQRPRIQLY